MGSIPAIVFLHPGKEAALARFHPWIFSGAIMRIEGNPSEGDIVMVKSARGRSLATGFWFHGSLAVKVFSFIPVEPDEEYWIQRLKDVFHFRERLGITGGRLSDAYRLVFSEGDRLPGLIIDVYKDVAVIQAHHQGMYRLLPVWDEALRRLFGDKLKAVYSKSAETLERNRKSTDNPLSGSKAADGFLSGQSGPVTITEAGHRFIVDFEKGQKTGFFLDQRSNRLFAQFYGCGRRVLNACCYSGAFSVYALAGGASSVTSLDSSKQALEWTAANVSLHDPLSDRHSTVLADVKEYLNSEKERFDMIILDPPAFAKSRQVSNNALHAYIHINTAAMKLLNPGGILMTFSCSQPVSREMFRSAIQSAAIQSGRQISLIHQLGQSPDHPADACHPEGEYLKGFIAVAGS